jgi:hypothetical protein
MMTKRITRGADPTDLPEVEDRSLMEWYMEWDDEDIDAGNVVVRFGRVADADMEDPACALPCELFAIRELIYEVMERLGYEG